MAAKAIIAKLPRSTRLSLGCIQALEMHKNIVRCDLQDNGGAARRGRPRDASTLDGDEHRGAAG